MNCMITGVSRGIGRALAAELLAQGHAVWGLSRTAAACPVPAAAERYRHSTCDLGSAEDRRRTAREMDAAGYRPDAVILNAAVEYEEDLNAMAWDQLQAVLRTNVEGALFWVAHWLDRQPARPVQFIGLSSLLALWPDTACPAYCASKAALSMAFRALRLRHRGRAAVFKLLVLGPVQTGINPRFAVNGPPARGVVRPEAVARHLAKSVLPGRRFTYYYPWTASLVCRFGRWLPDTWFERLTRPFRR